MQSQRMGEREMKKKSGGREYYDREREGPVDRQGRREEARRGQKGEEWEK